MKCFSKLKYTHVALMVSYFGSAFCAEDLSLVWYILQTKHFFFFVSFHPLCYFFMVLDYTQIHTETETQTYSNTRTGCKLLMSVSSLLFMKSLCSFFSLSNREIVLWSSSISCTTPCVSTSPCTEWVSAFSCFYSFIHHTHIVCVRVMGI